MTRTVLRHTMSALAAVAFVSVFASGPAFTQHAYSSYRLVFPTSNTQFLRVCVGGSRDASHSNIPTEADTIFYVIDQSGSMVLERELRPPAAGFQCIDIPYAELVAAGLPPDPRTG